MYKILIILLIIIIILYFHYKTTETFTIDKKYKVVPYLRGGLANRIYIILTAMSFAKKFNMDCYFLDSQIEEDSHTDRKTMIKELNILFPTIPMLNSSTDISNWIKAGENILEEYMINDNSNNLLSSINKNNIILTGYFQNEKVFFINPKIELNEPSPNILKNVDTNNLYFIHFRFGDYVGNPDFELDLVNYYKKTIKNIKDKNIYTTFLIVTNDISTTNKYIKTNDLLNAHEIIYDTGTNRLHSLYYMTQCKGGICANSSFSRIGAYFIKNKNKENIFYPNDKRDTTNMDWLTIVEI